MAVLQIKWVPAVFMSNTNYPARYIPENQEFEHLVWVGDENLPISALQTGLVDYMLAAIESNLPGACTVDMTTRRRVVFDKIDRRSREIVAAGYKHTDNRYYPATDDALVRYLNVVQQGLGNALSPFTFETLDQQNTLAFGTLNLGSAQAFAKNALSFAHNTMNSGFVLKDSVRACTTKAQLEAIVDSR